MVVPGWLLSIPGFEAMLTVNARRLNTAQRQVEASQQHRGHKDGWEAGGHKVRIYIEYNSVQYVPSSELGLSYHLSRQRVCPFPRNKGWVGGHTHMRVRGWGSPNSDDWKKLSTLCWRSIVFFPVKFVHFDFLNIVTIQYAVSTCT